MFVTLFIRSVLFNINEDDNDVPSFPDKEISEELAERAADAKLKEPKIAIKTKVIITNLLFVILLSLCCHFLVKIIFKSFGAKDLKLFKIKIMRRFIKSFKKREPV